MFLFYSGYGIYEQVKAKGKSYVRSFLPHRFLPTYASFAICVFFYFVLSLVLRAGYPVRQVLLSFIGWESIGNSNWFMFVTFALYAIFMLSFSITKNNEAGLVLFTVLSVLLAALLFVLKESWWWNTLLCFTLGMWWSRFRERIETVLFKSFAVWGIAFLCIFGAFACCYIFGRRIPLMYVFTALFFALAVCLGTMKFEFRAGRIFAFLGSHVFSIYILQRLVFVSVAQFGLSALPAVYILLCFVLTVLLACSYDFCFGKMSIALQGKRASCAAK